MKFYCFVVALLVAFNSTPESESSLLFATGTLSQPRLDSQEDESDTAKEEIEKLLHAQAKAWNSGDLKGFMQSYWKSDELTFSAGGKTTRGWQATLDRYVKRYAPPKEMGTLTFDKLETTIIEKNAALVLGNWHLKMKMGEERQGNFSLVLRKLDGQWTIVHDHSSSLEEENSNE